MINYINIKDKNSYLRLLSQKSKHIGIYYIYISLNKKFGRKIITILSSIIKKKETIKGLILLKLQKFLQYF